MIVPHTRSMPLGVLLLSRPVGFMTDGDATVLEFFGLYWVLETDGTKTGFFQTEADAVSYLQQQMEKSPNG